LEVASNGHLTDSHIRGRHVPEHDLLFFEQMAQLGRDMVCLPTTVQMHKHVIDNLEIIVLLHPRAPSRVSSDHAGGTIGIVTFAGVF